MKNDTSTLFASRLCTALAEALKLASHASWTFTGLAEAAEQGLEIEPGDHYRVSFGSPLEGNCFLAVRSTGPAPSWKQGKEEKADGENDFLFAAIRATVESIKSALRPAGREMAASIEKAEPGDLSGQNAVSLGGNLHSAEAQLFVHLIFDSSLVTALQQPDISALFQGEQVNSLPATNLELVMDVELNVTLRFGRRQLPLREVIDLTSGSVVELDRQVDEPVELVLDGRVVARGEAVIIDGNYGMRITQVVNPLQHA